ncbi:hypothetical protein Tco_0356245 [Tanacetum coccineum]
MLSSAFFRRPSTFGLPFNPAPIPVWSVFEFYNPSPLSSGTRGSVWRTGVVSLTRLGLGVLAVKVETVMGGSSPTFGPGKGVSVKKSGGGDSSLPFVMPKSRLSGLMVIDLVLTGLIVACSMDDTTDYANMGTIRLRWGSKSLRVSVESENKPEVHVHPFIGLVYHDLYLGGKALVERENVGFDLTKSNLCPSFVKDHTAKGVGLRVADSHTHEDDFTPLETIRRVDSLRYYINKAEFKTLELDDIEFMYLEQTYKSDMEETLKDFIKAKVFVMTVKNFQLSAKSYPFKLNLTRPQLTMPEIKAMEPYTSIEEPMFGVI